MLDQTCPAVLGQNVKNCLLDNALHVSLQRQVMLLTLAYSV